MSHLRTYRSTGTVCRPAGAAVAALKARAAAWDVPLTETGDYLSISVWGCELRLTPQPDSMTIDLAAPEQRLIGSLRDSASELFAEIGLDIAWDHVNTGELAPGLSLMRVQDVSHISRNFIRVRLTGSDAARFAHGGYHFRLLLAAPGRQPIWPRVASSGRVAWPNGEDALHRPVFTVSDLGPDWVAFDIFRHADSPTMDWVLKNPIGETVGIMGPGGGGCPDGDRLHLFGDQTALPAMTRILAESHGNVTAHIACAPHDLTGLSGDPRVSRTDDLIGRLSDTRLAKDEFVWFAAHADLARAARRHLLDAGLTKRDFLVASYWS